MILTTRRLTAAWLFALVCSGCGLSGSSAQEVIDLEVGPTTVACVGEAERRCLQVRDRPDEAWRNFYDRIEGFTHEENVLYRIRVMRTRIANPVADGSSFSWRLLEVLSRDPVPAG